MRAISKYAAALAGLLALASSPSGFIPSLNAAPEGTEGQSGSDITLRTELGQKHHYTEQGGKTYLRIDLEAIRHNEAERTPVNIAIVIDKSGSMNGAKIEQAKEAAIMAVERLGKNDYLSIIAYSDTVDVLLPSTRVNNFTEFRHRIRSIRSNGRTALYAGTKRGINELDSYLDKNRVNRVILLSDGLANVGPSSPDQLEELGRKAAEKGISITTIGLGLGFNEDLMTKLAYASDGNHAFVRHERDLVDIFNKEFGDVLSVVAQDVDIFIDCHIGFRPIRVLGREAEIDGRRVRLKLNQLYAAQEKNLIIEIERTEAVDPGRTPLADVTVAYRSMRDKTRHKVSASPEINYSKDRSLAEGSKVKRVMSSVIEQIATERNERAVSLRDKGKVEEARRVLKDNAAYLRQNAQDLGGSFAPTLNELADKNLKDSKNLDNRNWTASRKEMKARQYKQKTQQSY